MLGDYVGLAAAGKSFVAAYAVPNSDAADNPTDIYVSVLSRDKGGKED